MNVINILHTLSALSGIAMIVIGSFWLKYYLKRGFCCSNIS